MSEPQAIRLDSGQRDDSDLSGASPMMLNLLAEGASRDDSARTIRTRPGLRAWDLFPTNLGAGDLDPIVAMEVLDNALFYFSDSGPETGLDRKRRAYSVSNTGVWRSHSPTSAFEVPGTGPVRAVAGRRHVFAAGGSTPIRVALSGVTSISQAPPSTDIALITQRIVVTEASPDGRFYWSLPGEGNLDDWDQTIDFREAEARPDRVIGCGSTSRELYVWGAETTQVFHPDTSDIFSPGPTIEVGMLTQRSAFRVNEAFAWLDEQNRAILSDGRSTEVLSDRGMAKTFDEIENPEDVWGFYAVIGRHSLVTWSFLSAGRAFSYDLNSQTWSEWRTWRDGRWQAWAPLCHVYHGALKKHLVGMPDGTIAEMTLDAYADLDAPLKWVARTGFGPPAGRKHIVEARFSFERSSATSDASDIEIKWRDDTGPFNTPARFALRNLRNPDVTISPAGAPHYRRQWELSGSGADAYRILPGFAQTEEATF